MGEKIVVPPVFPHNSGPAPAPSPTNGNAAEVPLSVEKAYLEQIIENAPEAISIVDHELRILRINGEFTRVFGFTTDEAAGKRLDLLIVPPDRYAETAWISECIKTESKLSLETRRQRKDGSLVEVLLSTSPVILNGKRVGAYASYRDITEQKRAEELNAALYAIAARSQSAEDLQQFFAAIHNIVGQLMNARNFYLVRRGEVELIGASSLDWLGVPLKSGTTCIGALVVQSYNENARFGERDREILKFVSQPLAAAIERKRYEEALRRSEARSRSLILSAAFGICRCTLGGRFLDVNPALITMLGHVSVEDLLKLDVRREVFVNPRELDRLAEDYRYAGSLNGVEVQWKRKDGRVIIVRLSGCAAGSTDEPGEVVLELIAEDITDRRQLEEQLRQAQKMDAVGRLAGGVAHDFNNLLMVINGYTEVLLEQLEKSSPMHHKVQSIQQAADRAATLTRQLLAFSRKQLLELKVIDVNRVIGDMERLLRPLIGENIELVTRLSTQTGHTRADAGQLEQVIMNLVVNAKDAMPEGGKLTVQSSDVTVRQNFSEHRFIQPGRYAVISVADTGHGMDVGAGTTFYVYLPRVEESAEELSPAKSQQSEAGGCETVLLVEDEESVRELVRLTLASRGYQVLEAENGECGLRIAESFKEHIDILITDVVMPGIGGRELARKLLLLRPAISVLYLSGYTEDAVVTRGAVGPRTAFLQKPFTLQNLAKKVREVLLSRSAPPPAPASMAKSASN